MSDSISTLAELKAASQTPTAARNRLTYLFDEGKFTELDAYAAAGDSLAGVITAFGYVEGNPVYAFSQDVTVKDGALTEAQAKKIAKVYDLAAKTGVPVVGIFDSYGADVSDGSKALNAYGELLMWTSNLSGVVPQIAVVAGTCAGCAAMLAESADFTVIAKDAELYVAPNANIKNSAENAAENGTAAVVRTIRLLLRLQRIYLQNFHRTTFHQYQCMNLLIQLRLLVMTLTALQRLFAMVKV